MLRPPISLNLLTIIDMDLHTEDCSLDRVGLEHIVAGFLLVFLVRNQLSCLTLQTCRLLLIG